MKMECCEKVCNTAYCPYCGKEIGSELSLLAYLEYEHKLALRKKERTKTRLDPKAEFYHEHMELKNQGVLKTTESKIKRIESWINWVRTNIKNGEPSDL